MIFLLFTLSFIFSALASVYLQGCQRTRHSTLNWCTFSPFSFPMQQNSTCSGVSTWVMHIRHSLFSRSIAGLIRLGVPPPNYELTVRSRESHLGVLVSSHQGSFAFTELPPPTPFLFLAPYVRAGGTVFLSDQPRLIYLPRIALSDLGGLDDT